MPGANDALTELSWAELEVRLRGTAYASLIDFLGREIYTAEFAVLYEPLDVEAGVEPVVQAVGRDWMVQTLSAVRGRRVTTHQGFLYPTYYARVPRRPAEKPS
jgi:hypothetical protein